MPNDIPRYQSAAPLHRQAGGRARARRLRACRRPKPKADEVLVRVEAAPINPSDLGLLLGGADPDNVKRAGTRGRAGRHGARSGRAVCA